MSAPSQALPNAATLVAQQTFTALMRAMAEPGTIQRLACPARVPAPLPRGLAAVAAALADFETPVWLDEKLAAGDGVVDYLRFATGAPIVPDPSRAQFAFFANADEMLPFTAFAQGSDAYPDRSTTIVTEVKYWTAKAVFELSGPGIPDRRPVAAGPLPDDFEARMSANRALFPRGIDLVVTCGDEVVALPRSVHLTRLT